MLDIGGSVGALVVHTSERFAGREIEIARRGETQQFVHTEVRERHLSDGLVHAAVFAALPEGVYTLLDPPPGTDARCRRSRPAGSPKCAGDRRPALNEVRSPATRCETHPLTGHRRLRTFVAATPSHLPVRPRQSSLRRSPMHIPDGFVDGPTSAGAAVVAATGVGISLKRAAQTLQEKQIPLCGLVAAFIFAVQMLNFPVARRTSGHLLGGVLAAVLVGPWAPCSCVAVVLLVQALVFADGGAHRARPQHREHGARHLARRLRDLPRPADAGCRGRQAGVVVAAGVAAGLAVVLASIAFTVEYAIGGVGNAPVDTVFAAMVGVHTLDRHRRGRDHRAHRCAPCSRRGPTSCTVRAASRRPSASARVRSESGR